MSEPRMVKTIQDAVLESMRHAGQTVEVELARAPDPLGRLGMLAAWLEANAPGELVEGEDAVGMAVRLLSRHYGATV